MLTQAIQAEVKGSRIYHFTTPNVPNADKPHCNNCGDIAFGSYFTVGHFVLCQSCIDEAEGA